MGKLPCIGSWGQSLECFGVWVSLFGQFVIRCIGNDSKLTPVAMPMTNAQVTVLLETLYVCTADRLKLTSTEDA